MAGDRCPICGETVFDGWDHCPACKHPYPDPAPRADDEPDDEIDDDEEDWSG